MIGPDKNTPRSETIVRLPADTGSTTAEGSVERKELLPGVYLVGSLVKVVKGCVITSGLKTTEKEVNTPEPVVMVTEVDTGDPLIPNPKSPQSGIRVDMRES